VVSILPAIFWRQQISWSYCASGWMWTNTIVL